MAFSVNTLLQEAHEDLTLTGIGEPISGDLAAAGESCLNRAIRDLNRDGYVALTKQVHDIVAAGSVTFRKLEEGEAVPPNTINMEPPDGIDAVGRKIGMRYVRLRPSSRTQLDRTMTCSLPSQWCYEEDTETAPSGATRRIGVVRTNGNGPTDLRIYVNSQLPTYRLGDTIYLSSLYYSLIMYATEMKLVAFHKLKSYEERVQRDLDGAYAAIDRRHLNNAENMGPEGLYEIGDAYNDVLSGRGL